MDSFLKSLNAEVAKETEKEDAAAAAAAAAAEAAVDSKPSTTELTEEEKQLAAMDLREAGVNAVDLDELVAQCQSNDPLLTEVNLNAHSTLDGASAVPENTKRVMAALHDNTHVKTLEMAASGMDDDAGRCLATLLTVNTSLQVVNAETNDIHSPVIDEIVGALRKNQALLELKLSNQKQPIHSNTSRLIPTLLEDNKTLIKLSVDVKDQTDRNALERVLFRNRELAREARAAARRAAGGSSAADDVAAHVENPCSICGKSVFATERLVVGSDESLLHRGCFKCFKCKRPLTIKNYSALESSFFCKPCYLKLHKTKGNFSTAFSGLLAPTEQKKVAKETPDHIKEKFAKKSEPCAVCSQPLDLISRITLSWKNEELSLHAACLRCNHQDCNLKLTLSNYHAVDKTEYYCTKHIKEAEQRKLKEKKEKFDGIDANIIV